MRWGGNIQVVNAVTHEAVQQFQVCLPYDHHPFRNPPCAVLFLLLIPNRLPVDLHLDVLV